MELVLKDVNYQYKNKNILSNINLKLDNNYIYGIVGDNKTLLLELIDDSREYDGEILINGISNNDKLLYRKSVSLIKQNTIFFTNKVKDEMEFIIKNLRYSCKDIEKKEIDSLKLVGLDSSYLKRNIDSLSETEKTLVNIACNLLTNPSVIIFDEVFTNLDLINKKMLFNLIRRLKNNYGKIVIISSNNTNLLYSHTDHLIVLKNGFLLRIDSTDKIFKDKVFMSNSGLDVPYLVDFTNKAKSKKVKLSYHKDILDLIKDVYKHV